MVGVLLGAMVFGYLADRSVLGRATGPGWAWASAGFMGTRWEVGLEPLGLVRGPTGPASGYSAGPQKNPPAQSLPQGRHPSPYLSWHGQPSGSLLLFSPPPRQAGPPQVADLELSADGRVRNLRSLRSQLPRLLCLPAPLRHVAGWHRSQLHDTE